MRRNKVIYGNGRAMRIYWMIVACLTVIFGALTIFAVIHNIISVGILAIVALIISWMGIGMILSGKQVAFYADQMEIPKEYVTKDKLFSDTSVKYEDIKSVEYIGANEVEDDCTGTHGGKVSCIQFTDKEGKIYRMKTEYFSDKQVAFIIKETKLRAGIV